MSSANEEIARKAMEAYNQGDRDAWFLLHDPDLEFRAASSWPESETIRGRQPVWDWVARMSDAWEPDEFEMSEVRESGEKLVGRARRPVKGKASGIADVLDQWTVATIRHGRVVRQEWFTSRSDAVKTAGRSESSDPL